MALPLLAGILLGGAATQVGGTFLKNWAEDRSTDRAAQRAQGVLGELGPGAGGMSDFDRAAYGAGQLGAKDVGQNIAAMQRQQLATAPAMMNANLAQEQWRWKLEENQRQTHDETEWLKSQGYDNPFLLGIPSARDSLIQGSIGRMQPANYDGQLSWSTPDIVMGALQGVESGAAADPWQARGPMVEGGAYAGQQAYGPYQIMPGNIPEWTREATGTAWEPDALISQAMAGNEVARDVYQRTARHQVEKWQRQGYSDQDIASLWHSGRPLGQSGGARDRATGLPTQGPGDSYISRFGANIGRATAGAAAAKEGREKFAATRDELQGFDRGIANAAFIRDNIGGASRLPSGFWTGDDGKAMKARLEMAGMELFFNWKKEVYGDAEPTDARLQKLQDAFGNSTAWDEDREKTVRLTDLLAKQMQAARDYKAARAAYVAGRITEDDFLRYRQEIDPEEWRRVLSGEDVTTTGGPEGLQPGFAPAGGSNG